MSTTVPYDVFLEDAVPQLPGADEAFILNRIFATIAELCEDGNAWVISFGPIDIKANQRRIYLDPLPQNTRVGYIGQAIFGREGYYRRKLIPLTGSPASYDEIADEPFAFLLEDPGTMLLNPVPGVTYEKSLLVDCTVIPVNASTPLPYYFWTHYRRAIEAGVLGRMMSSPNKSYTDMTMGKYHMQRFRNYVKRTKDQTARRWGEGEETWRFPPFATGGPFNTVWMGNYGRRPTA